MRIFHRLAALALSAVIITTAGCAYPRGNPRIPEIGRDPSPVGVGRQPDAPEGRPRSLFERKRVSAKREASTLVADDATTCTVTENRYRETKVGDHVWCSWANAGE